MTWSKNAGESLRLRANVGSHSYNNEVRQKFTDFKWEEKRKRRTYTLAHSRKLRHRQRIALVPVELFQSAEMCPVNGTTIYNTPNKIRSTFRLLCRWSLRIYFCIHSNTIYWLNWKCLSRGVIKPLHRTRLLDVVDYATLSVNRFLALSHSVSFKSLHLHEFSLRLSCLWYCTHICTHFVSTLSSTHTRTHAQWRRKFSVYKMFVHIAI